MSDINLLKSLDYSVLQQCMHCGMCLPTCPTYDETKFERSSPRGRIRLMREVADGRLEASAIFAEEMSYCLGCLACQTACPAGVDYATLFENARGEIERERVVGGVGRRFIRWITLSVLFRHPRLLRAFGRVLWLYQKLGVQAAIRAVGIPRILPQRLRRLEAMTPTVRAPFSNKRIQPRETPSLTSLSETRISSLGETGQQYRVALLTGCVQDLLYAHINRATADVLLANGYEVLTPPVQYCCGSLHAHNGELELARDVARKNLDLFPVEELDAIITNAGGCGSHLKKYAELLHDDATYHARAEMWDAKVRDVHEWLMEIGCRTPRAGGDTPRLAEGNVTVTYDASCHLLHGQKIASQPLELLRLIPGVRLVPLPELDWCCGAAGVYTITQPEQSAKLLARKLDHIAATGAQVVASGNPGCLLQLEMGMRRDPRLAEARVCHPIELLAEAYAAEMR